MARHRDAMGLTPLLKVVAECEFTVARSNLVCGARPEFAVEDPLYHPIEPVVGAEEARRDIVLEG